MTTKVTLIFHQQNIEGTEGGVPRPAGFSETWYNQGDIEQSIGVTFRGRGPDGSDLASARAQLLPESSQIIGARFTELQAPFQVRPFYSTRKGLRNNDTDLPQVSILCRTIAKNAGNVKSFILRNVPDDRVKLGEASFTPDFKTALNAFFKQLGVWQFRCIDKLQPVNPIITINGDGVAQLLNPIGFAVHDPIQVLYTTQLIGSQRKGFKGTLSAVDNLNRTVTIRNWPHGVCNGGRMRKYVITYLFADPDKTLFQRTVVRKVGRPFELWRGRATRRP